MIYKDRNQLAVVKTENMVDEIVFDILAHVILEKPSNVIYFVSNKKLYRMVSMGDIARAGKDDIRHITINKKFNWINSNE